MADELIEFKRKPGRPPLVREDAAPKPQWPKKIRLTAPHGFIDHNGSNRHWDAEIVIDNEYEISLLVGRGALHEVID